MAEATAAVLAAGDAPLPLSFSSRPKPTSAFGIAEEHGVLAQGPNPLPYTVPEPYKEPRPTAGVPSATGVLGAGGPRKVVTEKEIVGMRSDEVARLEREPNGFISEEEVRSMPVEEIRRAGFGRNQTGQFAKDPLPH